MLLHQHHGISDSVNAASASRHYRSSLASSSGDINRAHQNTICASGSHARKNRHRCHTIYNWTAFLCAGNADPLEMEGHLSLPEAQLDRSCSSQCHFPTATELVAILGTPPRGREASQAEHLRWGNGSSADGRLARKVPIPTHVSDYVAH